MNDVKFLIQAFNVEKYLSQKGIRFYQAGKNVKQGWIGIRCRWCSDTSNHLGINLTNKSISCWKCGIKGTAIKLVMRIDGLSFESALNQLSRFSAISSLVKKDRRNLSTIQRSDFELDRTFSLDIAPYCYRFLENRGFDPKYLFRKYKLLSAPISGRYAYSLIIPYYSFDKPLTFVSRHTARKIYSNCPSEISGITTKQLLYGSSNDDTIIVVEGVTDQWNIGDGSVALGGTKFSPVQIKLLTEFERVFIVFDPEEEAQKLADRLGTILANHCSHVEVINIGGDKDPGDLPTDDIKALRNQIFSKRFY